MKNIVKSSIQLNTFFYYSTSLSTMINSTLPISTQCLSKFDYTYKEVLNRALSTNKYIIKY